MKTTIIYEEHRRYLAAILWRVRRESRALPPMVLPKAVTQAAKSQGYKFRGLK